MNYDAGHSPHVYPPGFQRRGLGNATSSLLIANSARSRFQRPRAAAICVMTGPSRGAVRDPAAVDPYSKTAIMSRGKFELLFSTHQPPHTQWVRVMDWAIGAVVARSVHTGEVAGSNPVSPTK